MQSFHPLACLALWTALSCGIAHGADGSPSARPAALRAGALAIDISPRELPVRQNGGFLERSADRLVSPLYARALVLNDGATRIALAVIDSCMVPRELCDAAKEQVEQTIGIPRDHVLISATHTHSAPGVMDYCLGSRADPTYTRLLPGWIAEAIIGAARREEPAELGYTVANAPDHTHCRRWIRRLDRPARDPFGEPTVFAMMHPGHGNPDYVGPSGPDDPALSLLSVRTISGRPLAVLGNFSMHYYGFSGGLSPDFFGEFAHQIAERMAPGDSSFVGILSQGTSGDLWRADYSRAKSDSESSIASYTTSLVELAVEACSTLPYRREVPLAMAEQRLRVERRVPDAKRLAWAKSILPDRSVRPRNRPEVYAEQAFYLAENPSEEIVLQAIQVGGLGITGIPCEVYALTGLELKVRSPLQPTFHIELANGAAGYIPPPEQHALGGYNTWPARTAGLEVDAEPKIVDHVLSLLEKVSGEKRREPRQIHGAYGATILAAQPLAYWRLEEFRGTKAIDSSPAGNHATIHPRAAFYVPGPASRAFSEEHENRCVHLIDGSIAARLPGVSTDYTIGFWFWNGVQEDDRELRGHLFRYGTDSLAIVSSSEGEPGVLSVGAVRGTHPVAPRTWNQVVFTRRGHAFSVYLNGRPELAGSLPLYTRKKEPFRFGSATSSAAGLEGRIDEIAVFARELTPNEVSQHYDAAGLSQATDAASATKVPGSAPPVRPRSPMETLRSTRIRQGFRLELVAAEPLVIDPVAIDWDGHGRLWVAEMGDYPMGGPDGGPAGRIRVLEDRSGDGRYDHATVFASALAFPNGVMAWRDGALVTAAPDILYLVDHDGDLRADHTEVLYTGFLPGNQQLRVNGLRWGLDNWIYCASGGHHAGYGKDRRVRSIMTDEEILLGSRDLRIRPFDGRLEAQSGPAQFGRIRDDWGHWFGVQNSRPIWHYVLTDHYSSRNPHLPAPSAKNLLRGVSPPLWPAKTPQKRYHSFEDAKRFTSGCGPSIYRDDLLFPRDHTTHAFTCDPFHGIVQHNVLTSEGVSFKATPDTRAGERDFFAATDRWCRPVMTRTGPDGALWIVDMYRYMIEHPRWLPELGKEELRPYYRTGDDRGRIYRVLPESGAARPAPLLADSLEDLVGQLGDSNGIVRDRAHRALVERRDRNAGPLLESMATRDPRALARVHALAALEGLGILTERVVLSALGDADPRVARQALRMAEPFGRSERVIEAAVKLLESTSADTRLQLAHTLGEWNNPRAGEALATLAVRDGNDPWMRAAILSSAVEHQRALASALTESTEEALSRFAADLLRLAYATDDDETFQIVRDSLLPRDQQSPHGWQLQAIVELLDAAEGSEPSRLESLSTSLGPALEAAARIARDPNVGDTRRSAAVALLGRDSKRRTQERDIVEGLLEENQPQAVQLAAVARLRAMAGSPDALLKPWPSFAPAVRNAAFGALVSRSEWTAALLDAVEEGSVPATHLSSAQRQRLVGSRNRSIAERASALLPARAASARRDALAALTPALHLNGLATRGRKIFEKRCGSCHAIDGVGQAVGPDLRALTDRSASALLGSIVDPNAAVEPRYEAYAIVLHTGEVVNGLVTGETGNSLHLRLPDGSERLLLRNSIAQLESSGKSFMPEGLEADISLGDMADLIAFLQES